MSGIEEILAIVSAAAAIIGGVVAIASIIKDIVKTCRPKKAKYMIRHVRAQIIYEEKSLGKKILENVRNVFIKMYEGIKHIASLLI